MEPSPESRLAELGVFIATAADREPASPVAREIATAFKREVRRMLESLADRRFASARISAPYLVRVDYNADGDGGRRKYAAADDLIYAWLAAVDLLARPDVEVLRCRFPRCKRGYEGPRLFIRSRHSLYCSQTCSNNTASDNFLAKFVELERRKKRGAGKRKEQS